MKVTVCFGGVRVIVPCGNGELLVSDLKEKAVTRYKKAILKPPDYWVTVHNLKSSSDGGILDPDDHLNDVADDREQIIALYEEQDSPPVHHNGGDGTSASSVGTASPDIFQGGEDKSYVPVHRQGGKNDMIITQNDLNMGSGLLVRRTSEPALINIGTTPTIKDDRDTPPPTRPNKRWSAIATLDASKVPRDSGEESGDEDSPVPRFGGNGQEKSAFSRFARDSGRQSVASGNAAMYKWLDAQEKAEERFHQMHVSRKEPLGGSDDSGEEKDLKTEEDAAPDSPLQKSPNKKDIGAVISLRNTGGPLGIHVVPDYDDNGRDMGLIIQGIEPGGRIFQDGRLKAQDRIIEINGTSLVDVDFTKAQEIFKMALQTEEIRLRVVHSEAPPLPKLPPPVLPKPNPASAKKSRPENLVLPQTQEPASNLIQNGTASAPHSGDPTPVTPTPVTPTLAPSPMLSDTSSKPGSPTKKVPPPVPTRHSTTALSTSPTKPKIVAPTNTRKIGKKILIQLTKGPEGLGFSVTTRDNPAGGHTPIYIKNILPKGAAIQDNRLKSGDRLLEVNGIEMTGKTQSDAVGILRTTKLGSVVNLVVSRQTVEVEEENKFAVPRALTPTPPSEPTLQPPDKVGDESTIPTPKDREMHMFDIPLNDTGSAGLGVSVKGKTSTNEKGTQDLGIFIKSVISGGAASKDGRIKINDQLVEVNGESLVAKSNADAMESLRQAMQKDDPKPGFIHIVIARRKALPVPKDSRGRELKVSQSEPQQGDGDVPITPRTPTAPVFSETDTDNKTDAEKAIQKHAQEQFKPSLVEKKQMRNPVLDRLMSGMQSNIRNESYMRATHDSLNETTDYSAPKQERNNNGLTISSPTLPGKQGEMRQDESQKPRPVSSLGFRYSTPGGNSEQNISSSRSSEDLLDNGAPKPPEWLSEWEESRAGDDDLSPVDPDRVFMREGFGRQSMSEKRKGHIDPATSEFFQKIKESKDNRVNQYQSATWERRRSASVRVEGRKSEVDLATLRRVESMDSMLNQSNIKSSSMHDNKPQDTGPTLGLKKSSSLESLQTAVQEATLDDDANGKPPNRGMVRGRGWNDSFRAAVDRSYEGPMETETMETLDEEESETGSTTQGPSGMVPGSTRSSFSENETGAATDGKKLKKTKSKKEKQEKDKGGILKGLGHMFRFGRHRKTLGEGDPPEKPASTEPPAVSTQDHDAAIVQQKQDEINKLKARRMEEQERLHQYWRAMARQREAEVVYRRSSARQIPPDLQYLYRLSDSHAKFQEQYRRLHEPRPDIGDVVTRSETRTPQPPMSLDDLSISPNASPSRAERIQQLRAEHQKRHMERQGKYPQEDKEELYERQLQEYEQEHFGSSSSMRGYDEYNLPPRRRTEDNFDRSDSWSHLVYGGLVNRPQSRQGYADPGRYTERYSHYQNYQEIQAQLQQHEYYQDRYQQYMAQQQQQQQRRQQQQQQQQQQRRQHTPHLPYQHAHTGSDPASSYGLDPRPYPRHYSQPDTRQWMPPPPGPQRSVTPGGASTRSQSPSARARSQTPINQLGYLSHHNNKAATSGMLPPPPQVVISTPQVHYGNHDYMDYDDPRTAYSSEPSYGSLTRRSGSKHSSSSGMMSGPAQV